jgi:hypothetical protein
MKSFPFFFAAGQPADVPSRANGAESEQFPAAMIMKPPFKIYFDIAN